MATPSTAAARRWSRACAQLGTDRFDDAMRTYVEQNAGRIATTDDLVGVWLSASDDPTALHARIDVALFG